MVNSNRIPLTVFFPCHNERENIAPLVRKTLEILPTVSDDYEIIIVNDGSTDDTARIADQLAAEHPCVRVVHHEVNQGYGRALQSGFRAAARDYVFYTDGDAQFDIAELADIVPLIRRADVVTCYRLNRTESFLRRFNGWAWSRLVNALFRLKLRDVDCAFKLYKREIFDNSLKFPRFVSFFISKMDRNPWNKSLILCYILISRFEYPGFIRF